MRACVIGRVLLPLAVLLGSCASPLASEPLRELIHAAVSLCTHSSATTKVSLAPRARQPLSPWPAAAKLARAAVLAGSRVAFAAMRVSCEVGRDASNESREKKSKYLLHEDTPIV